MGSRSRPGRGRAADRASLPRAGAKLDPCNVSAPQRVLASLAPPVSVRGSPREAAHSRGLPRPAASTHREIPLETALPVPQALGPAPPPVPARQGRIPGNRGMWVGILCELTEFGLMFVVYFIARAHHPADFHAGPGRLSILAGTVNTLLMLTSSYLVARALGAIRQDRPRACLAWLGAALVAGAGYPLVKFFEVQWNLAHGLNGDAGIFFTVYYYLTFNHLVHVCWGLLGLLWVMARTAFGAYDSTRHEGLEAFGCYWHTTDMAWLVIFPLFYVWR